MRRSNRPGLPAPEPGSCALVTGASSGLGAELARELAARGHDVVLVARRKDRLDQLGDELRNVHGVRVEAISCDLTDAPARSALPARITALGLKVSVLVNCAGFGMTGAFTTSDPQRVLAMVQTNFAAVVALTHSFAGPMVERGRGAILIVSSLAGFHPAPMFSVYAATKAASLSFAEALSAEVEGQGVMVTTLCPGPVDTEFDQVMGIEAGGSPFPPLLIANVGECVRAAIDGLERGRHVVVPKRSVQVLAIAMRLAPHSVSLPVWQRFLTRG
jgi:short-subunit dehydrogenase